MGGDREVLINFWIGIIQTKGVSFSPFLQRTIRFYVSISECTYIELATSHYFVIDRGRWCHCVVDMDLNLCGIHAKLCAVYRLTAPVMCGIAITINVPPHIPHHIIRGLTTLREIVGKMLLLPGAPMLTVVHGEGAGQGSR